MNCLILFSGTKSFSKVLLKKDNIKEIRTVDLDNKFNPTYNVDILKWDYKKDLKDYKIDYIHSSPVCKYFSKLQHLCKSEVDINKGFELFDKSLEIIEYVKLLNPKLKFTIENPKNKSTLERYNKYKYKITSYCNYEFMYQKDTTFWYGGFELKLKDRCNKKNKCKSKLSNDMVHKVRIGLSKNHGPTFLPSNKGQIGDSEYLKELKEKEPEKYKKYTNTYFRYRIPPLLIEDIYNCL